MTADRSGLLTRVDVKLNPYNGGNGISGDFKVFDGPATNGAPAMSVPYAFPATSPFSLMPFSLPPSRVYTRGQVFTFTVSGPAGAAVDAYFTNTDRYAPGPGPLGGDLVFETHMVEGVVDQAQLETDDHVVMPAVQSMVAGRRGSLIVVDLKLNTYNDGAGIAGDFRVYLGDGVAGTPVATSSFAFPASTPDNLVPMAVNPPVPLLEGDAFTIQAVSTTGTPLDVYFLTAGQYGAGSAANGRDLVFRTHMALCP